MLQTKVSLEKSQIEFLDSYEQLGFRDRSAVVRAALDRMRLDLEQRRLQASAALYAELYDGDVEMQQLTEAALAGWPE